MIELSKDDLLHYFPYRRHNGQRLENKSIYHTFLEIEQLLWKSLNVDGELALKLFDYQADVTRRKKHFEKMRNELSKDLQQKQEQLQQDRTRLLKKHFNQRVIQQFQGNIPFSQAKDPEQAEEDFNKLNEEYEDVLDALQEIQEEFDKKMKGISKVKLKNTDAFTREEITNLPGALVMAVRPLLKSKQTE